MSEREKPDSHEHLIDAYERMIKRTGEFFEQAEQERAPRLRHVIEKVRDNMVELGELTREEAIKVGAYVERDIQDAARYIAETGDNLRAWWHFDVDLMEQRLLDLFALAADQTRLQLESWAEQARQASVYGTGEITGPGTLVCNACGKRIQMHKAGQIPPCPKCHATAFTREVESGGADDQA
ncbi:MAG: zinc ribbon-containing protein [Chromatiaceae bacterium]|jgi:rubrerythrin